MLCCTIMEQVHHTKKKKTVSRDTYIKKKFHLYFFAKLFPRCSLSCVFPSSMLSCLSLQHFYQLTCLFSYLSETLTLDIFEPLCACVCIFCGVCELAKYVNCGWLCHVSVNYQVRSLLIICQRKWCRILHVNVWSSIWIKLN